MHVRYSGRAGALGLSLIEILVCLAVLAVLIGIGAPSLAGVLREQRITAHTSELHVALFHARSLAVQSNSRVTLCTSLDGVQCSANTGWHRGWIAFSDANGNALVDDGEPVLWVRQAMSDNIRITGNAPVRDYVSYTPLGSARMVGGAMQIGTITACSGGRGRQLVINSAGRPRVVGAVDC